MRDVRCSWRNDEGDEVEIMAVLPDEVIGSLITAFEIIDGDEEATSIAEAF